MAENGKGAFDIRCESLSTLAINGDELALAAGGYTKTQIKQMR